MVWKKTKLNNESGICPNLTFEDDEFKEDNKAYTNERKHSHMYVRTYSHRKLYRIVLLYMIY
jgi:hypothetical protein